VGDNYLFWQIVTATLRGLVMFGGLLMVVAVWTAVKKALPMSGLFQALVLQLPRIFLFTLPMAVLFGTVQTFGELSSRGEVTAFGAGGMSLWRIMRAPLIWGAMLVVIAFTVQEAIVPGAEQKKNEVFARQLIESMGRQKNFSYRTPSTGLMKTLIQAEVFDPKESLLINPSIQFFDGRELDFTVTAEKGMWNEQTGKWQLINQRGFKVPVGNDNEGNVIEVNSGSIENELTGLPGPDAMTRSAKSRQEHLEGGDFEMVSIGDLRQWRDALKSQRSSLEESEALDNERYIRAAAFGIHDKFATPLICFALILVAAPLGIRPQRSGGGFSFGISIVVILLYYVTWSWASYVGKVGEGNPYLLAYVSVVVTTIIGLILVRKKSF
jgi:lipopolysaccharide export system permease protein